MDDASYEDDEVGGARPSGKGRSKSRRELPTGAVATLKAWLLSPEHFTHPYPTPQDQTILMEKTGIDKKQLKNWFTNARRRIWKPMLKKQIEQGKLSATGAPLGGIPAPSMDNPHSVQAMRVHYQQAMQDQPGMQQQQQTTSVDYYGNNPAYSSTDVYAPSDSQEIVQNNSIGTLAQLSSSAQLSKTDSHAVLMELFARDQDLVRQATESARLKAESKQQQPMQPGQQQQQQQPSAAYTSSNQQQQQQQHPMIKAPSGVLQNVPSLNSWPHFSSITSLNNLGTIPGVKSIASLSGQDLASKGNVNKMGNLAQVKSMESMGKNDSYAFLEVFFGDRSSTNLSGMGGGQSSSNPKMNKQGGDEDNEIGLSLEDESPSHASIKKEYQAQAPGPLPPRPTSSAPGNTMPSSLGQNQQQDNTGSMDTGTLKRAYDDAMAARGLISVSRSSEKLTDLELPAKIQRTLSQEFIKDEEKEQIRQQHQQQQQQKQQNAQQASQSVQQQQQPSSSSFPYNAQSSGSVQYPGQHPTEPRDSNSNAGVSTSAQEGSVAVSSSTTCCLCSQTSVDTQLRPCGHMFHERCLKPSFSHPNGAPKCPIDDIPIASAVLAIPETNNGQQQQQQPASWVKYSQSGTA